MKFSWLDLNGPHCAREFCLFVVQKKSGLTQFYQLCLSSFAIQKSVSYLAPKYFLENCTTDISLVTSIDEFRIKKREKIISHALNLKFILVKKHDWWDKTWSKKIWILKKKSTQVKQKIEKKGEGKNYASRFNLRYFTCVQNNMQSITWLLARQKCDFSIRV